MKDLEKMRKDFEREYRLAELSNKIMAAPPEIEAACLELNVSQWKEGDQVYAWFSNIYPSKMTEKLAAMILYILPSDEKFKVYRAKDTYEDAYYDAKLERKPNDSHTILKIYWMHEGIKFCVEFPITRETILGSYFKNSHRKLSDIEISSYGIQCTRWNKDYRDAFQILDWSQGKITYYQGGCIQQRSDAVLNQLVEDLKYSYQFSEE